MMTCTLKTVTMIRVKIEIRKIIAYLLVLH